MLIANNGVTSFSYVIKQTGTRLIEIPFKFHIVVLVLVSLFLK